MTVAAPATRRSVGRKLLIAMAALLGFSLAWYVVVRAISPWTAVKVIALDITAARNASEDGWRVATYNIA